jgi:hypothetical protein
MVGHRDVGQELLDLGGAAALGAVGLEPPEQSREKKAACGDGQLGERTALAVEDPAVGRAVKIGRSNEEARF